MQDDLRILFRVDPRLIHATLMKNVFGLIASVLLLTTLVNALQTDFLISSGVVPPATVREI